MIEYITLALIFEAAIAAERSLDLDLLRAREDLARYLDRFQRPLSWRRQVSPWR